MVASDKNIVAALEDVALVDRSNLGKLRVTGADRLDLLHRLSTNDLLQLKPFSSKGTVFTTERGRIVDSVRLLAYPDSLLLISACYPVDRIRAWIEKYTIMEDIRLEDVTDSETLLTLVGPNSLQRISSILQDVPGPGEFRVTPLGDFLLSIDHQQEFGLEWVNVLSSGVGARISMERLLGHLSEHGVKLLDGPTFECYRILQGIPGEGELTDAFNPYDVNLRHAISFTKGCYIGQEVIARLDTYQKVQRGLALLSFKEEICVPSHSVLPVADGGEQVGVITSASHLAFQGRYLGLGILKQPAVKLGDRVTISTGSRMLDANIDRIFW